MEARGTPLDLLSLIWGRERQVQPCDRFAQLTQAQNFASVFKQVWHCDQPYFNHRRLDAGRCKPAFAPSSCLKMRSPGLVDRLADGGSCAHAVVPM